MQKDFLAVLMMVQSYISESQMILKVLVPYDLNKFNGSYTDRKQVVLPRIGPQLLQSSLDVALCVSQLKAELHFGQVTLGWQRYILRKLGPERVRCSAGHFMVSRQLVLLVRVVARVFTFSIFTIWFSFTQRVYVIL